VQVHTIYNLVDANKQHSSVQNAGQTKIYASLLPFTCFSETRLEMIAGNHAGDYCR